MADIFISYASQDLDGAAQLASVLEGKGWNVWWDRRLRSGTDFTNEISQQLETARCVVVLWSKASVASTWVRDEASEGMRRHILVPVAIEAVQPPYGFRSLHTAQLIGWRGDDAALEIQRIVADLEHLLGPAADHPKPGLDARVQPPKRQVSVPGIRSLRAATVLVAVLALAAVGMVSYRNILTTKVTPTSGRAADAAGNDQPAQSQRLPDAAREPTAQPAGQEQVLGPYATLRRAEEVAIAIREKGEHAVVFQRDIGYYVKRQMRGDGQ